MKPEATKTQISHYNPIPIAVFLGSPNPMVPVARADRISRTDNPASAAADGNHVLHRTLTLMVIVRKEG